MLFVADSTGSRSEAIFEDSGASEYSIAGTVSVFSSRFGRSMNAVPNSSVEWALPAAL